MSPPGVFIGVNTVFSTNSVIKPLTPCYVFRFALPPVQSTHVTPPLVWMTANAIPAALGPPIVVHAPPTMRGPTVRYKLVSNVDIVTITKLYSPYKSGVLKWGPMARKPFLFGPQNALQCTDITMALHGPWAKIRENPCPKSTIVQVLYRNSDDNWVGSVDRPGLSWSLIPISTHCCGLCLYYAWITIHLHVMCMITNHENIRVLNSSTIYELRFVALIINHSFGFIIDGWCVMWNSCCVSSPAIFSYRIAIFDPKSWSKSAI